MTSRGRDEAAERPDLLIVGGGRMGTALATGLIRAGWRPSSIAVAEKLVPRRNALADELPGVEVVALTPAEAPSVVLAVKPADAEEACRLAVPPTALRVLSIMAGVTTGAIESWLEWVHPSPAVLRAMPNTPALVGAGISALAGGGRASEEDFAWAEELLEAVGTVVRVDEADLDAVTGLSGSGPAYVFLLVEMLQRAGVRAGLDPGTSQELARRTLVGAARLLEGSSEDPEELRAQVTSPGGTTEAGVEILLSRGVEEAFAEAVLAATRRSRELGGRSR